MASKSLKQKIVNEINKLNVNIKAESVVNGLLQNGLNADNFVLNFKSRHKRNWEFDIQKAELINQKIHLKLSRDGIVQSLPEYVFYRPLVGSKEEIEEITKFNREQTIKTRYLFNPIEDEFFHAKVALDAFENNQMLAINFGDNKSLKEFWKVEYNLTDEDMIRFCKLLPSLFQVVGDFPLTAQCLAYLLSTDISFKTANTTMRFYQPETGPESITGLGHDNCGNNLVAGNCMDENASTVTFKIGPIKAQDVTDYLTKGSKQILLECFSSYFIPYQYEVEYQLDISSDSNGFLLENSYIGFNTKI